MLCGRTASSALLDYYFFLSFLFCFILFHFVLVRFLRVVTCQDSRLSVCVAVVIQGNFGDREDADYFAVFDGHAGTSLLLLLLTLSVCLFVCLSLLSVWYVVALSLLMHSFRCFFVL